jgi:hypothetical protein
MPSFAVYEVWCLCLLVGLEVGTKGWSARGVIGHASFGPLRARVKVANCCDPYSVGTLTCVKLLLTCVESVFATVSKQFAIADCCLLFLVRMIRPRLHYIKSPNQPSLITSLKSHNLTVVRNHAKRSNPFDIPIFQQTTNSACGYTKMARTVVVGIRNMCMSRRWKAEQVIFRSCIQTPVRFINLRKLTLFSGEECVIDVRENCLRKTLFYLLQCSFDFTFL